VKPVIIIAIAFVLLTPLTVFASHEPPSPFEMDQLAYHLTYYGIFVLPIVIIFVVIFRIRKNRSKKRKENQRGIDFQKLKDKVEELEKDKVKKE